MLCRLQPCVIRHMIRLCHWLALDVMGLVLINALLLSMEMILMVLLLFGMVNFTFSHMTGVTMEESIVELETNGYVTKFVHDMMVRNAIPKYS